jgi:N-acetylglucosaminyldiphosphoundecaprenol N-acetyl-beta-D-mannosaminyltransferase
MRIRILDIPIDGVTRQEALDRVEEYLEKPGQRLITTPNPEMLVEAAKDARFREALQKADLAIPDGNGLLLAARMRGKRLPERVTGTDLVDDIAGLAARRGDKVFLLGAAPGVATEAAEALTKKYPGLIVAGAESGGQVERDQAGIPMIDDHELVKLIRAEPDILFVAFGHGKQEEWILEHLSRLPTVRVAMGVGGAFDFIAGRVRRAPAFMRRLRLEWLWRLILQPRRLKRIWNAVFVFLCLVLREKG